MIQSPWGPGLFPGLGVRVLAPLSQERWSFPFSLLLGVEFQTWRQIVSVRSFVVVLLEILCLLPLLLLLDAVRRPRAQEAAPRTAVYAGADTKPSSR
jgi:hypothetical protein